MRALRPKPAVVRLGCLLLLIAALVTPKMASAAKAAGVQPVVVAVVGETGGINVLHADFRTPDGRLPAYPADMPRPVVVPLPRIGNFASAWRALERGILGHMQPGTLYAVAGTRLLLVNAGADPYDALQSDAIHATGVADSVTGTRHGSDPQALVVVVLSNQPERVYSWLSDNSWVDLASTSDYAIYTTSGPTQCVGADAVRAYTASGHLLFGSSGNTTDQGEPLVAPNGLPQTYLVGGVDSTGQTWLPPHPEESDPFYAAANVGRPYESGELFSYGAAAPDSFTGIQHFGGTSGATPLTAGWAARLVAVARTLTHSTSATRNRALAVGPARTARGPLADGTLTNDELRTLLHSVAVQHSGLPGAAAYALEGYGALNADAERHAEQILAGSRPEPSRAGEDTANDVALQERAAVFARCG